MKQKKTNRVALLLHWAGEQKVWLFLAVLLAMAGGLCIVVPYIEIYRLMDAAFGGTCTKELVVRVVAAVAAAVVLRFVLFGASGVVSHKGAYGALFKVRCMVAEHMAKVPLGALNERRTGDIKTVLNEDIEKLELFLAHNLPDLVCYLVGPVVVFAYLMTVNIPLALISLVPLVLAVVVMAVMFRNTDDLMDRANRSITALNSVMIEYISGMKLIKAYNMGSSASLEQVRAAAKEAQIDNFIMSLPDGYDTKVGSFGSRFSGGEKQRIAIARAILKNAPILILDEATSASDPENQMEIDRAIQNLCKGKTVIVVAHRLSALKMCERVAVVEDHTITCVGTHEEVRRDNAYYRKAWEDYEKARNITYQLEGGRVE